MLVYLYGILCEFSPLFSWYLFYLFRTDSSLDSSGVDISSPKKNKKKKKHKEHPVPVKSEQQHSETLRTDNYSESAETLSSHKKRKRKNKNDDSETSFLSVKHQKLDTPAVPSTSHSTSDIVSSPFKTKHKKHKSKTWINFVYKIYAKVRGRDLFFFFLRKETGPNGTPIHHTILYAKMFYQKGFA